MAIEHLVAKKMFFTKGVGHSKAKLGAFEDALRDAGIQKENLVHVSSIIPPNCEIIKKEDGIALLQPGAVTFLVLARIETNEQNRLMAASVGLAVPKDSNQYGYLQRIRGLRRDGRGRRRKVRRARGYNACVDPRLEFDVDQGWDEKSRSSSSAARY